jgi:hypothetical protein
MRAVLTLAVGLTATSAEAAPAAVPTFASASSAAVAASPTLTIAAPADAGPGRVLAAVVTVRLPTAVSPPAGWAQVLQTSCSNSATQLTQAVFVKAASLTEPPAYTFTATAATAAAGSIVSYTGVDAAQPVNASGGKFTRNSRWVGAPPITTTVPGTMLLAALANAGNAAIPTPAGMTLRGDVPTGAGARLLVGDQLLAAAGPTGDRSAQTSGSNPCSVGQLVALRPGPDPPASTAPPVLSGTAQEGSTLTATTGAWSNAPTGYAYAWQRFDGGTWLDVPGATGSAHALTAADVGFALRVVVTASNAGGSATAASAASAAVLPAAPASLAPPVVSGSARENEMLSASPGTWSGSPTGFAYAWERCAGTCAPIAGATGETYLLAPADVGSTVRAVVTASNAGGEGSAASAESALVQPAAPPAVIEAPALSGTAQEGETLTATTGTWSGLPTAFAFQWQRSAGADAWEDVPGATAPAYTLVAADVGALVRVVVTAVNASGPTGAPSAPSDVVAAALPPANVGAPAIAGTAHVGETVTASAGEWAGPPAAFAFQWQLSTDGGAAWDDVADAVSPAYVPQPGDLGALLRVTVTATNVGGSTAAASAPVTVLPPPPASLSAPLAVGEAVEGGDLSASAGGWLGDPSAFAYQWQRCDAGGGNCMDVWWAQASGYPLRAEDVGLTVRVVVTATNAGGSTPAVSPPTAVVLPLPPVNHELPAVTGVVTLGEALTAAPGGWESSAPLAYAYRWQRSGDDGVTWEDVGGAAAQSYVLLAADVGFRLRAVVAATNAGGATEAASEPTAPVAGAGVPIPTQPPQLSGTVHPGRPLNSSPGGWTGFPTAYAYQWQRSDDGGATWADLAGATGVRLNLTAAHLGASIRLLVAATNEHGTSTAASGPVVVVNGVTQVATVNQTWYCTTAVDLDLVKVTVSDGANRDAVRFDDCSGRIGRVEVDTNGADGLKVRNNGNVAHDLVVESGYVVCTGHPEGIHQDGIQGMGGYRLTFRNLVFWCGDLDAGHGEGFVSSALLGTGGAGVSIPTDVVIEHSVMGMGNANGVHVGESVRNGIRNSVACPDRTPENGPVSFNADAVQGVDVDNEKPGPDDPRCTSFAAALAWAQG